MSAAAKNLTSVTLELGGKCPAIVSDHSDLDIVANRLLSGRLANTGQTCVCIDYVLCSKDTRDALIPKMKKALESWYKDGAKNSSDYGRIINARHFKRIDEYLKKSQGKIEIGGDLDESDLYISPTVLIDPSDDEPLMNEEIFGPILPIRVVENLDQAIQFVNKRDIPLALYVFSKDTREVEYVLDRTRSGGVTVNDSIFHLVASQLPFGGVGPSGMGAYHGKYSFDAFSHQRATLYKSQNLEFVNEKYRYPPLSEANANMLSRMLFKLNPSSWKFW
jgi:acyl-CoA reductase-like NAD-dependent aldehyde dehydrogenase